MTKYAVNASIDDRLQVSRVLERFTTRQRKSKREIFYDLCFCICAPQTTFVNNRRVIARLIKEDFYAKDIPTEKMHEITKPTRFYKVKTWYLMEAKKEFHEWLYDYIRLILDGEVKWLTTEQEIRDFLAKKIKGLGMKAASHFCRNLGYVNVAIIDTHILKFLGLVPFDVATPKKYREVEKLFCKIAEENGLSAGELDALLWKRYSNTPWSEFTY